jgi:hypothetical protein
VDLRGNVLRQQTNIIFSTGATIPATSITGAIFDAVRGTPDINALVEAISHSDTSLVYVAPVDSTGRFIFHSIQPGSYLIHGYIDENHNRGLDATEPFDSITVALKDSNNLELLTFVHDSMGPRLGLVEATDSVTIHATFDTPIALTQHLDTTSFVLLGPDSAHIQLLSVTAIHADTVIQRHDTTQPQRRDTVTTPQQDTAIRIHTPIILKPTRPLLVREAIITVRTPLRPKSEYRLRSVNIRGANGKVLTSDHPFTTPAPPAPKDTTSRKLQLPAVPPSPPRSRR